MCSRVISRSTRESTRARRPVWISSQVRNFGDSTIRRNASFLFWSWEPSSQCPACSGSVRPCHRCGNVAPHSHGSLRTGSWFSPSSTFRFLRGRSSGGSAWYLAHPHLVHSEIQRSFAHPPRKTAFSCQSWSHAAYRSSSSVNWRANSSSLTSASVWPALLGCSRTRGTAPGSGPGAGTTRRPVGD
jgi:hypothetical protein